MWICRSRAAAQRGNPVYDIVLQNGTLFKPKSIFFSAIDAYGKNESGDLIFLQFTKSMTHLTASWGDLSSIVKKAKRHEIKRRSYALVYWR